MAFLSIKGNCAILQDDYRSAINFYNVALENRDAEPPVEVATNLAWIHLQLGKENRALALMDDLIETTEFLKLGGGLPVYISAVEAHAEIYALASEFDVAIADMDEVIELASQISAPYVQRGRYYRNIYEWDKALEDFNTALQIEPYDAEAYFQRGLLYYSVLQTGQALRDEALADFHRYLELWPEGPDAEQARNYLITLEAEIEALNGP